MMNRRRAMLRKVGGGGGLPAGYTQLEYIQATGSQWADTNIYINFSRTYLAEFEISFQSIPGANSSVFGMYDGNRFSLTFLAGDRIEHAFRSYYVFNKAINLNTFYTVKSSFAPSLQTTEIDGDTLTSTLAGRDQNASYSTAIFGRKNGASRVDRPCYAKMKNFKYYENGVLLFNGTPCLRDSDSKAGFYDLNGSINPTTNTPFYPSASSTDFVAGYIQR